MVALNKNQALAVADQMIADVRRRNDERRLSRLVFRAGPKPAQFTLDRFEALVVQAETLVLKSWTFRGFIATLVCLAVGLFVFKLPGLVSAVIPAGFIAAQFIRRRIVGREIRRNVTGNA